MALRTVVGAIAILSTLLISGFSSSVFAQAPQTITLGTLGHNNKNDSKIFQSLVGYIASKLGNGTIGRVIVGNNTNDIIRNIKNGQIDLYVDSSLLSALVDSKSGAVPLLRAWTGGVPSYHSVFITRQDSPIIYHFFDVY